MKYRVIVANWWSRSANTSNANNSRKVSSTGANDNNNANNSNYFAPDCITKLCI